jgi:hypothetical protein
MEGGRIMNPVKNFRIDNYKEILKEIEKLGKLEFLRELEERIIQEIGQLVNEGTDEAREKIEKLEESIKDELEFVPRNRFLISALKNSILGAIEAAKFSL